MPFLVLHGEADTVTDPEVSRALYEGAASTDKTFKLYPGMWHGLTAGEPDENVELVFSDILAWLDQRSRHWEPEERVRTPPEHSYPEEVDGATMAQGCDCRAKSPWKAVGGTGLSVLALGAIIQTYM
jgi:hypothetical protein